LRKTITECGPLQPFALSLLHLFFDFLARISGLAVMWLSFRCLKLICKACLETIIYGGFSINGQRNQTVLRLQMRTFGLHAEGKRNALYHFCLR
jgi:hypothetical protein